MIRAHQEEMNRSNSAMLSCLHIILVRPRFPENIGMAARAMANMGTCDLTLVAPERWDREKADPLATGQGLAILDKARVEATLEKALESCTLALGTTARTGGWRDETFGPEQAARLARAAARQGGRIALVFGPEDKGLTNAEVALCTHLVTIPTAAGLTSLNLAQAVLLLLYECVKADRELPFVPESSRKWAGPGHAQGSRRATLAEEFLLLRTLQDTLLAIEYLPADNPDWFMRPVRRFLRKSRLRRHEFDMLMGICRRIGRKLDL